MSSDKGQLKPVLVIQEKENGGDVGMTVFGKHGFFNKLNYLKMKKVINIGQNEGHNYNLCILILNL